MRKEDELGTLLVDRSKQRPSNENQSTSWVQTLAGSVVAPSTLSLVIFFLLLFIPITALVIGIYYHDPRYCPIEPRLSIFLIVNGSVSIGWILLIIFATILTIMTAKYPNSSALATLVIVFSGFVILLLIFLIIWLIFGSIWTFNVYYWVNYYYDARTNFYPYDYCQPEFYRFTFVYLIFSYVFMFFQCAYHCFNNKLVSTE
ncbi:unnamed protein product [Adineta ricciae]|uniref:Uncharacterized protein n=1 Tax=Adineta ricciae TaxID=249248 RepID=A0A814Z587_ADIRI|nr:unnamed protein product [Adineta ricciae]CAF1238320.1 unnamed protein product [Adineta ricciae]